MSETAANAEKELQREKKALDPRIAFALMIIMIICALCIGANKAWKKNRVSVDAALAAYQENIEQRVETAYNVLTVARRYLPEDDLLVQAVRSDLHGMESASTSTGLKEQTAAASVFSADATALLAALAQNGTVSTDARDSMYVTSMLPQAVEQCCASTAADAYNKAAQSYNEGMHSFSGLLARLTGVNYATVIDATTPASE